MIENYMANFPYEYDKNGFLKQKKYVKFPYSVDYKNKQGTNSAMALLRFAWISGFFKPEIVSKMNVVDIGCGSGEFIRECTGKFGRIVGYDIVGDSISDKELYETVWDMIVLSDVLEHLEDVENLFKIKWKNCMLSFPETPVVKNLEELYNWRHCKPNEHLYCLTARTVRQWLETHEGVTVIGISNFEDIIRTRWDFSKTNISSIMAKRKSYEKRTVNNNAILE